jgi:hypothetical protein
MGFWLVLIMTIQGAFEGGLRAEERSAKAFREGAVTLGIALEIPLRALLAHSAPARPRWTACAAAYVGTCKSFANQDRADIAALHRQPGA